MKRRDLLTAALLLVALPAHGNDCTHPLWMDDGWYSYEVKPGCKRHVRYKKCLSCGEKHVTEARYEGDCGGCT